MYRPARDNNNNNPSFSSSLLDQIYRSIDDRDDHKSTYYRETKQSSSSINGYFRNEAVDFKRSSQRNGNSSSSSSDSSSGGGFSSSETESVYRKPIRTTAYHHDEYKQSKQMNVYEQQRYQFEDVQLKQKQEGKFVKTKSRAMKIYGDLKKVKQPISPGGRLATFLNSIFTNTKRSSSDGSYDDDGGRRSHTDGQSKSAGGSTCSSASSFSRSCLSKSSSSRGKLSNKKKRSVRFYPVSVIVGDDCQPCGHKSLYGDETRRIEEAARNLLKNYQKKVECEFDLITNNVKVENEIDLNYEDDDDVASNSSSDLFELENFSAIGMDNYGDELPVYETTRLDTNLAIGNGFRM